MKKMRVLQGVALFVSVIQFISGCGGSSRSETPSAKLELGEISRKNHVDPVFEVDESRSSFNEFSIAAIIKAHKFFFEHGNEYSSAADVWRMYEHTVSMYKEHPGQVAACNFGGTRSYEIAHSENGLNKGASLLYNQCRDSEGSYKNGKIRIEFDEKFGGNHPYGYIPEKVIATFHDFTFYNHQFDTMVSLEGKVIEDRSTLVVDGYGAQDHPLKIYYDFYFSMENSWEKYKFSEYQVNCARHIKGYRMTTQSQFCQVESGGLAISGHGMFKPKSEGKWFLRGIAGDFLNAEHTLHVNGVESKLKYWLRNEKVYATHFYGEGREKDFGLESTAEKAERLSDQLVPHGSLANTDVLEEFEENWKLARYHQTRNTLFMVEAGKDREIVAYSLEDKSKKKYAFELSVQNFLLDEEKDLLLAAGHRELHVVHVGSAETYRKVQSGSLEYDYSNLYLDGGLLYAGGKVYDYEDFLQTGSLMAVKEYWKRINTTAKYITLKGSDFLVGVSNISDPSDADLHSVGIGHKLKWRVDGWFPQENYYETRGYLNSLSGSRFATGNGDVFLVSGITVRGEEIPQTTKQSWLFVPEESEFERINKIHYSISLVEETIDGNAGIAVLQRWQELSTQYSRLNERNVEYNENYHVVSAKEFVLFNPKFIESSQRVYHLRDGAFSMPRAKARIVHAFIKNDGSEVLLLTQWQRENHRASMRLLSFKVNGG